MVEMPAAVKILISMQMSKLGMALDMGRTGAPAASSSTAGALEENGHSSPMDLQEEPSNDDNSVRPQRFKSLVGRGHPEFSSPRQQVMRCLSIYSAGI